MTQRLLLVATLLLVCTVGTAGETVFYVSPSGNDAWPGRLPSANAAKTNGPFATLTRAQEAVRNLKAKGTPTGPISVQLREGKYCVDQTLSFGPADAGTKEAPVTWGAYKAEKPQIIGGRLITGLKPGADGKLTATLPDVAAGKWSFKSLFMDGQRLRRARYPNYAPSDPYRKGFRYAAPNPDSFSALVGGLKGVGDWMEYDVNVPADGEYRLWVYYTANNVAYGIPKMDGRTVLTVDGGEPVPLNNLADTTDWRVYRWANTASVKLTAGKHRLHWQIDVENSGLGLVMFSLSDEPDFKPADAKLPPVPAGQHRVLIPACSFVQYNSRQLFVEETFISDPPDHFYFSPGDVKPEWAQAPGAEIHIFQSGWGRGFMGITGIKSIDAVERRVELTGPELSAGLNHGDRYFVENVAFELDAPGEWYLDNATGLLTVIPPAGCSAKSELMAPAVQRVIEVIGGEGPAETVSNLNFSGLTIRGGDWNATDGVIVWGMGTNGVVFLGNATACSITGCSFANIGKDAICVHGGGDNNLIGNDITDSAEGGINVDGSVGNTIARNHIHHCGQVYKHNGGVCLQKGSKGNLVSGNVIHDMTRYGITMKYAGHDNVIECNRIQNTNLETYDTGGIEVTQGDRDDLSGSKIRYNIVADTIGYSTGPNQPMFLSWSIYLDSFAGGYEVYGNTCYRSNNGGIMFQGGKGNNVHNNIFVDGRVMQALIQNFADNQRNCQLDHNIFCFSNPASGLFDIHRFDAEVITADNNLYCCSAGDDPAKGGWDTKLLTEWQKKGFDANSVYADPLFVNPGEDDYTLRPDSPAFKLGFEQIDTSRIAKPCGCNIVPQGPIFFAPDAVK